MRGHTAHILRFVLKTVLYLIEVDCEAGVYISVSASCSISSLSASNFCHEVLKE